MAATKAMLKIFTSLAGTPTASAALFWQLCANFGSFASLREIPLIFWLTLMDLITSTVGCGVGLPLEKVGAGVGNGVGLLVSIVGISVGTAVGRGVGLPEGTLDGLDVG